MQNLGIHRSAISVEVALLTAQDLLVSNYVSKTARHKTVTMEEAMAWKARMAELASIRNHSHNCFCDRCVEEYQNR